VKSKLKIILPVLILLLVAGGGAYKFVLAKPSKAAAAPKPKVDGDLFALTPEFVVNLTDNHYGKVTVALLLKAAPTPAELAPPASDGSEKLLQDAIIRATITDDLTGVPSTELINRVQRDKLRTQMLTDLTKATDVEVTGVLFTDVVVQ
jgi:flagellar basal body-associated protein FliL